MNKALLGLFYFLVADRMQKTAVFIDAGYLFAQGSAALAADRQSVKRDQSTLNIPAILTFLRSMANAPPTHELLRIYWYDGAAGQPSIEQLSLAKSDNVKLRLGIINIFGQQKGVDALIVTDLIELARNKAISDAILMSGDEDIRVGVSIAQEYGVRVHLLGIDCDGNSSQSSGMVQEADTVKCLGPAEVGAFLTLTPAPAGIFANPVQIAEPVPPLTGPAATTALQGYVGQFCGALTAQCVTASKASPRSVIQEVDRMLLGLGGRTVGRPLDQREKRALRQDFLVAIARI